MPDAAVVFMLPLRSGMIVLCTLEGSNWRSEQMELVFMCLQRKRLGCAAGDRWGAMAWSSQVPIPPIVFIALHRWLGPVWPADLQFRLVLAQRLGVASGIVAHLAGMHLAIDPKSNEN